MRGGVLLNFQALISPEGKGHFSKLKTPRILARPSIFSTGTRLQNFLYTRFFHENLEAIVPKVSLFNKELSHFSTTSFLLFSVF